jgi:hypothetical protein
LVILADGREDVEHERSVRPAVGGVLDSARQDIRLERAELVGDALDDERLHALEHYSELLVRVAVKWNRCARLEADEIQHGLGPEQGLTRNTARELEGADGVETSELRLHALDYRCYVALVELELLRRQAFVDGAWIDSDSGETFPVTNPATGEVVAEVRNMGALAANVYLRGLARVHRMAEALGYGIGASP